MFMLFRNASFRVKIFIIIYIAILLPTVMVGTVLYKRSELAITDQTSRVVTSSLNFAIQNIDSSLELVVGMSDLILKDSRFTSAVSVKHKLEEKEKIQKYAGVRELFSYVLSMISARNILEGMDSFYVYITNQNTIIDSKSTFYEEINESNVEFIRNSKSEEYNGKWFVCDPVNYFTINNINSKLAGGKVITYNRVLKERDNVLAVLAINVNENFLSEYYKKIQTGIPGEFLVMDNDETIIAHSDKSVIGKKLKGNSELNNRISKMNRENGSFFFRINGQDQFLIYSISKYTGWRYIVMVPASEMHSKIGEMQEFFTIIISIIAFMVLGITILLSNIFYKPLEKLVSAMQMIENRNLDVKIDDKRADEYQRVYKGFNDMVSELKRLIKDLTNEKILKKEAEIKLLQAQINPHFLYNTLESIHSIAKIKKVEEIALMVSSLSKFYRIRLSGGKDIVTLKEAVELVKDYLTIQNIRFKGKISYNFDISDELMKYKVPKLILQPVVENSIYHGIERRKGNGILNIYGMLEKNDLNLVVEDNGVGIEKESLEELQKSIEDESFEDSKNFALKNLNQQIKLKYGQNYGLSIKSEYGQGTCVTIRLPAV
ncbi:MAG TPA: sensor histidine kinase [Clostridiaceae bacterium]|nr:sensor histidine kinase [Clostridiaceae bacterium]